MITCYIVLARLVHNCANDIIIIWQWKGRHYTLLSNLGLASDSCATWLIQNDKEQTERTT